MSLLFLFISLINWNIENLISQFANNNNNNNWYLVITYYFILSSSYKIPFIQVSLQKLWIKFLQIKSSSLIKLLEPRCENNLWSSIIRTSIIQLHVRTVSFIRSILIQFLSQLFTHRFPIPLNPPNYQRNSKVPSIFYLDFFHKFHFQSTPQTLILQSSSFKSSKLPTKFAKIFNPNSTNSSYSSFIGHPLT